MKQNVVRFRFGAVVAPGGSPLPHEAGAAPPRPPETAGDRVTFVAEACPALRLTDIASAWEDLARRALERNIFAEYAFAFPALQHMASEHQASAVLVWRQGADGRELAGLFLIGARRRFATPGLAFGWHTPLCGLGTPLIDAAHAAAVAGAFLDHIAGRSGPGAGLLLPMLAADGPVATVLAAAARARGLPVATLDRHERAVLGGGQDAQRLVNESLSGKKLKELRRQLRRLGDQGKVRIEEARDPQAVREATEIFLALEASGWKGARRTALVQSPGTALFVRAMTRLLARDGRCRVELLHVGEVPVAAALVLQSGDQAWFWKVAYDERFARHSPGVQLTLALTHRQLAETTLARTDSCAIADHPMIDHLWRERLAIADLFIGLKPESHALPAAALRLERARRGLRAFVKHGYYRLRGEGRS